MAFDPALAGRVRDELAGRADVTEKRMFGGLAFLVGGVMACGISGERLMVRLGEQAEAALEQPGVGPFDETGRTMRGWVLVAPAALVGDALGGWVRRGVAVAERVPPKAPRRRPTAR